MKKLISMTDFVTETMTKPLGGQQVASVRHAEFEKFRRIRNYAEFLKQPLTLGMFIPCDENGVIFEEPERIHFNTDFDYKAELSVYQEAKWRVLFEGFELSENKKGEKVVLADYACFKIEDLDNGDIEDLVKYNLELNQSTINQLGL